MPAPGATQHITVGASAFSAVTAQSQCSLVTVGEDPSVAGWPTTDFYVSKPGAGPSSASRRISAGGTYTFDCVGGGKFLPGSVVGYVETVSGSTTFFQDET